MADVPFAGLYRDDVLGIPAPSLRRVSGEGVADNLVCYDMRNMWKPAKIGTVIARRELTFERGDERRRVVLAIGAPVREPSPDESSEWYCPAVIQGLGSAEVFSHSGEDALHSLVLALKLAEVQLATRAADAGGRVYWMDEEGGVYSANTNPISTLANHGDYAEKIFTEVLAVTTSLPGELRGKIERFVRDWKQLRGAPLE